MMGHVRVASYNLYLGADLSLMFGVSDLDQLAETVSVVREQLDRTRFEERARAVAALLARERPDLVGLQEVTRWAVATQQADGSLGTERTLADFQPALVEALEAAACAYDVHVVNESFSGAMPVPGAEWLSVAGANVTLVRHGLEVLHEASAPFTKSLDLVTGFDGLTFPVARSWGRVDVRVDGLPMRFVNAHTEAWDTTIRDAQRDELIALNDDFDGPVVMVGDFNATRSTSACLLVGSTRGPVARETGSPAGSRRPGQRREHAGPSDRLRLGPRGGGSGLSHDRRRTR